MLDFANYLKENFREDTSSAEKIIKSKWDKVTAIIKEAFDDRYADRKTAIYRIQNEFVDPKIAPKSIDVDFLKNNMNYVMDKVNSLDEGEIRIIINNEVQKGSSGAAFTGMETESKKGKKKNVVKEEMDDVEPTDDLGMEVGGAVGGDEEEKTVKVSVEDNKVTVEPSENTGLERSEHIFEDEEEASAFVASLENLFKGFKIENAEPTDGDIEDVTGAAETEEESTKTKKKLVSESEGDEEPEDAGEEPEDAGEEPEDAGEEPEDAGEEPEDAGEEPEDAADLDWEDIADSEGDEDAEECIVAPTTLRKDTMFPMEIESLDLSKLVNTLVKVENKWYKVNSISENNEVVCIDKEGTENYFDLDQIDEMEQTLGELAKETDAEEEVGLMGALSPEQMEELKAWIANPEEDPSDELYQALMDYYADEMPYGIQKARDGDPFEWLLAKTSAELGGAEEQVEPDEEESEPAEAEEETQEESLIFAKFANRYMDLDEDALTAPKMATTQGGGLTSKPGVINQTITPVKPAPKTATVKGPTAALTANPSKPGGKIEKVPSAPSAATKKGPAASLTATPKAPPKKVEKVKSAPKAATKAGPKAALTAKPGKTGQKVEKVKAPAAPTEYKKSGFKG